MSVIDQALSILGGAKTDLADYFSQPNPYPKLKSPIPASSQVTQQLPVGVQSPVTQAMIVPHPAGQSFAQTDMQNVAQALSSLKQTFTKTASDIPAFAATAPNSSPTPTPVDLAVRIISAPQTSDTQVPKDAFKDFETTPIPKQYQPIIYKAAQQAGIDPSLLASQLFTESGLRADAKNGNTNGSLDRGIAQINNMAHPEITDDQAYDPNFAIQWAANLLSGHIKQFDGDVGKAIAAYRVGPNADSDSFNTYGQEEINKVTKGLSPSLLKKLGLKASN